PAPDPQRPAVARSGTAPGPRQTAARHHRRTRRPARRDQARAVLAALSQWDARAGLSPPGRTRDLGRVHRPGPGPGHVEAGLPTELQVLPAPREGAPGDARDRLLLSCPPAPG